MTKIKQGYKFNTININSVVVYGIVNSRRLGKSLGINLFSDEVKGCNFDCVYCQYGRTHFSRNSFLQYKYITTEIQNYFEQIAYNNIHIDYITLAGNGEPTLHPKFKEIVDFILQCRNKLLPNIPISIFTNATLLGDKNIREIVNKIDKRFVKLDASNQKSFVKLGGKGDFHKISNDILKTSQEYTIEISTAVIKNPEHFSNYNQIQSIEFANVINIIKPSKLILYSINKTPAEIDIEKISKKELFTLKKVLINKISCPIQILE